MQHISNNGNRPLALYLGQFVFASDQRKLGTEHDSTRPGKTSKKVPISEKILMLGVKKF